MALTEQQQAALAADVALDPAFASLPHNSDGAYAVAQAYNELASPDFIVWRSSVSQDEIMQNGFDWVRVDNLSVGKARIWEWLFSNQTRSMNPSKVNVRAGIDETWKGTAADLAVRAAVYAHCTRAATRAEKLFASGTGTVASPATMTQDGALSYNEVQAALGW
jgi:hypothetical protein